MPAPSPGYALYPVVRSRNLNLLALASVDYKRFNDRLFGANQEKTTSDLQLSVSGDARDDLLTGGVNTYEAVGVHGRLQQPKGTLADNPASYSLLRLNASRLQNLLSNRLLLLVAVKSQYALQNLDATEQFQLADRIACARSGRARGPATRASSGRSSSASCRRTDLRLATVVLANGGDIATEGVLHLGTLQLNGGTLSLVARGTPTALPLDANDPEFAGKSVNGLATTQAGATVVQDPGGALASAVGTLLAVRATNGRSILLDQPGNTLRGGISAVSGALGENDPGRFTNPAGVTLRFVRIASSEIHSAGKPNGDPALLAAGIEGDVVKLSADTAGTDANGLIRARLPFSNLVGSNASIPRITFVLSDVTLSGVGHFGTSDTPVQVHIGASDGGFFTARPHVGGDHAVIFLGGAPDVRPFYDGSGKLTEIRVFYNGDAPRTPQEAGALAAVIGLIEDARHARFEEAVRTENVSSRLRSGVIAEVGAGRPATVGRESIRLPETCESKPGTLQCGDR